MQLTRILRLIFYICFFDFTFSVKIRHQVVFICLSALLSAHLPIFLLVLLTSGNELQEAVFPTWSSRNFFPGQRKPSHCWWHFRMCCSVSLCISTGRDWVMSPWESWVCHAAAPFPHHDLQSALSPSHQVCLPVNNKLELGFSHPSLSLAVPASL